MDTVLVTGSAGFIGFYVSKALLDKGYTVIGFDNMNDYYDVALKKRRIDILKHYPRFYFYQEDICRFDVLERIANVYHIDAVIHLAAQAGVRYSLECPEKYIETNIVGTFHILKLCQKYDIGHLMYASSSSVYGNACEEKLSIDLKTDFPVSLYAATKKSDELLAYVYANNFGINMIGMRFFTVYGPWGRPDMAYYSFIGKILNNETIEVFNYGKQYRDFTYIDDLLEGVMMLFSHLQQFQRGEGGYEIYNIGSGNPIALMTFIETIECVVGKKANKRMCQRRTGDVEKTYADLSGIQSICDFWPKTSLKEGLKKFYSWYQEYNS